MRTRRKKKRPGWMECTLVAERYCPSCGKLWDAVTGAGEGTQPVQPTVGDLVICLYCSAVQMLTVEGVRLATTEECMELSPLSLQWLQSQRGRVLQ